MGGHLYSSSLPPSHTVNWPKATTRAVECSGVDEVEVTGLFSEVLSITVLQRQGEL